MLTTGWPNVLKLQVLSQLEGEMVNCSDMGDVASFALRQYMALTGHEETEDNSEMLTLTMATIVRSLIDGIQLSSAVAPNGKDAWVHTLIPENVTSPICNSDQTGLNCCTQ